MKKKNKLLIYTLASSVLLLQILNSCKRDDINPSKNSGFTCIQDFKDNSYIMDAINAAGITIYDGTTPPLIEGEYNTNEITVYNASSNLSFVIGQYLNSLFKYYDQESDNTIKCAESSTGLYSDGIGAFISGTGQYYTVWLECSNSDGSTSVIVESGHKLSNNDLDIKSVTVLTENPPSGTVVGDWWACVGPKRIINNSSINVNITTNNVSNITYNSVTLSGVLSFTGATTTIYRGFAIGTQINPTYPIMSPGQLSWTDNGSGQGTFTSTYSTGLQANTTYYVRAYASDHNGNVWYGGNVTFTLLSAPITDIDGNTYNTIQIGSQTWMKENLKTTKYRDGTSITYISSNSSWQNTTSGAYCNYDNNSSNANIYGRLYNWYAVNNNKKICPNGWHIPTDADWNILINYLGGENVAGGKMKEAGTVHWQTNVGGTNSSGFTALPSGYRLISGSYDGINSTTYFWSSTLSYANAVKTKKLYSSGIKVISDDVAYNWGSPCRCVKD